MIFVIEFLRLCPSSSTLGYTITGALQDVTESQADPVLLTSHSDTEEASS